MSDLSPGGTALYSIQDQRDIYTILNVLKSQFT